MKEIIRNRTIRPSTRHEKSKSYKIDTKDVTTDSVLKVNINHESKPFTRTYWFSGSDVAHRKSISFRVYDSGTNIDISWSGAKPLGTEDVKGISEVQNPKSISGLPMNKVGFCKNTENLKQSLDPIADDSIEILILGTMLGDKSILAGEYYAHPRNKFWKIISKITDSEVPEKYSDKKSWLLNFGIGVWDVANKVIRKGSLDSAIENEVPNDLDGFFERHKKIKVIGFNGKKAEVLFDKYFLRKQDIKYIPLPSSSPANTGFNFEEICAEWNQLLNPKNS